MSGDASVDAAREALRASLRGEVANTQGGHRGMQGGNANCCEDGPWLEHLTKWAMVRTSHKVGDG